jgi:hypothetical protein
MTPASPTIDSVFWPVAFGLPKKMSLSIRAVDVRGLCLGGDLPLAARDRQRELTLSVELLQVEAKVDETSWSAANFRGTRTPPDETRPKRLPEPN